LASNGRLTEAFPWDSAPKYLIRDNDKAFGVAFKTRVRAMGIRDRPTLFRSPWQNGYVERLIGSIRRECADHLIVFNAEHQVAVGLSIGLITQPDGDRKLK
jgi:transposase InsO family protein